ncbi:hypothetical protein MUO93_08370 [Candidatus Bathyarchaeota archaeon]|jgi:hypothetical protein|nr:hypothetical protein [Candidatus Bathyarchaeota archaeon]
MTSDENLQKIIYKTFQDPIADLLLKQSNLTRTQFETLIIDLLTDILSDKKLSFYEKSLFRKEKVSRGSFSRTLAQARSSVISSIFTIVLLSYIGVLDKPFEEYQELAEKLRDYIDTIEDKKEGRSPAMLKRLEEELLSGIRALSKPTRLKIM